MSRPKPWIARAIGGVALLWLASVTGCGGGGGSGGPEPPPADATPPTVPQSVTATAESATQVRVTWQASTDAGSGVAGYRVFRDDSVTPIATVTVTNHVDVNLAPGTRYTYTVRAFDGADRQSGV